MLQKPEKGGMPEMEMAAISMVMDVMRILSWRPPIRRMSFVPMAWITLPAPRKRRALKKA